mmetsp:Transcript_125171/g.362142  ORF Transcript_125171/g.362142 Transcript_125171/m.362142 type:complete len:312 (+) Transcript_125171:1015-1950(+)
MAPFVFTALAAVVGTSMSPAGLNASAAAVAAVALAAAPSALGGLPVVFPVAPAIPFSATAAALAPPTAAGTSGPLAPAWRTPPASMAPASSSTAAGCASTVSAPSTPAVAVAVAVAFAFALALALPLSLAVASSAASAASISPLMPMLRARCGGRFLLLLLGLLRHGLLHIGAPRRLLLLVTSSWLLFLLVAGLLFVLRFLCLLGRRLPRRARSGLAPLRRRGGAAILISVAALLLIFRCRRSLVVVIARRLLAWLGVSCGLLLLFLLRLVLHQVGPREQIEEVDPLRPAERENRSLPCQPLATIARLEQC